MPQEDMSELVCHDFLIGAAALQVDAMASVGGEPPGHGSGLNAVVFGVHKDENDHLLGGGCPEERLHLGPAILRQAQDFLGAWRVFSDDCHLPSVDPRVGGDPSV